MQDGLGIAARVEAMARGFELPPQRRMVVDLPVVDDPHLAGRARTAGARHRLRAAGEIDDRQTLHRQAHRAVHVHAGAVGAAVEHRATHRAERGAVGRTLIRLDDSDDSAHEIAP
jgi:hypothetical protein